MALFKILSGNSSSFTTDLSSISIIPPFNEGYCYFIKDTQKFYLDWKDSDGGLHRTSLNEDDIASKMDKNNPVGSGSFSIGRKGGSTTGSSSFAVGTDVTASGPYSFAQGNQTTASETCSHAEGNYTETGDEAQHVEGKYNIITTGAHIIGNGSSSNRSNAYTLDWDGNAWFSGDVYVGSTSGTNKDEGSKQLATIDYDFDLITTSDIDTICAASLAAASEVSF